VNPPAEEIGKRLRSAHLIAVVGRSPEPTRGRATRSRAPCRGFAYRIIPVTPAASAVLGEVAVPALAQLPQVLAAGERVDIVDVFRRSGARGAPW
jgi:predicted CoA-binding protein